MKKIEFEVYEINDLNRILEYALKKKKEDLSSGKINSLMYNMDKRTINILMAKLPIKDMSNIENMLNMN